MILKGFISAKSVIDDVHRDTQAEVSINYEDATYWLYECLALLNQPLQFIRKVTGHEENPNLDITNYRAELPCDFYKLERIAVNGYAARYSTNSFHHLLSGECCGMSTSSLPTDVFIDNFGNSFSPQASIVANIPAIPVTFDINNNYITLSVKEGKVCIAYLAFPTDSEGFPMIPDDINYKVACKKYLTQKIRYIDWAKDPSDRGKKALFDYDEREWLWYAGKSISAAKIPHPEQMESLKNQLIRMIPNVNEHSTFNINLGTQQRLRIT